MAPNSIPDPSRDYTLHPTFAQLSAAQPVFSAKPAITAIAACGNHPIGLRKNGSVVAVGDNTHGQCSVHHLMR